ncbi:MAG: OsmC family peroxiredoxin [Gammaproteobacteria bacterium]|nr:OsmC family protein [Gammaproteobacteria bacterium]NNC98303.1 OsmC family peroxiredoxin [Gammaproteobacteria bacterium]NNM12779.1 OsmC family peroxiredoxin [Gammaproteobacteria bacterium]
MQDFPHLYTVSVSTKPDSHVTVEADNLPSFEAAPPAAFGGPGNLWSPEDLLMAAAANCLVLSFKAIARASKLEWLSIECESRGTLDKVERKLLFTKVLSTVKLRIPQDGSVEKAEKLLHKAEAACLVTNSMSAEVELECEVVNVPVL